MGGQIVTQHDRIVVLTVARAVEQGDVPVRSRVDERLPRVCASSSAL